MNIYRQVRKEKNLSQVQIAESCGMSRFNWHCIEVGKQLPRREQLEKIGTGLPCREDRLSARELRLWTRSHPFQIEAVNPEPWIRARKHWAYRIDSFGLSPELLQWIEKLFLCDSGVEAYGWVQLACLEGRRQISNPHELGFDRHPIVLKSGIALGSQQFAGLQGRQDGLDFLVWPQVWLRTPSVTFRVDGLLILRRGKRSMWAILEFDGFGHEPDRDQFRRESLGLPEIRLTSEDVKSLRVAESFVCQAISKSLLGDSSLGD